MTTTDTTPPADAYDARLASVDARLDRLQGDLDNVKASMDALHADITAWAYRVQEQLDRPRYASAVTPPPAPRQMSFTPYIVIPLIASWTLAVGLALHAAGVL